MILQPSTALFILLGSFLGVVTGFSTFEVPTTPSEDGWAVYNNTYYKVVRSRLSFWDALKRCQSLNATLVMPRSAEENDFLATLTDKTVWLGMTDKLQEGVWRYLNGQCLTWSNWHPHRPNGNGDFGHTRGGAQKWDDWTPPATKWAENTVCQLGEGHPVDFNLDEWEFNANNSNYYKVIRSSLSFWEALDECERHGASLVMPRNAEENEYLATLTEETVWLGMTDKDEEGVWRYLNGDILTWSNWHPHRPNGNGDFGHTRGGAQKWDDWKPPATKWAKNTVCQLKLPEC